MVLDHQGIESTDIDADVAFLVGTAGMTLIRWGVHALTGRRIAMLHDGAAAKLELIEVDVAAGEFAHTAFAVDDLDAAHARAIADGAVELRAPFRIEAARATSGMLRAAGGSVLQLIRYDPDSPDLVR